MFSTAASLFVQCNVLTFNVQGHSARYIEMNVKHMYLKRVSELKKQLNGTEFVPTLRICYESGL